MGDSIDQELAKIKIQQQINEHRIRSLRVGDVIIGGHRSDYQPRAWAVIAVNSQIEGTFRTNSYSGITLMLPNGYTRNVTYASGAEESTYKWRVATQRERLDYITLLKKHIKVPYMDGFLTQDEIAETVERWKKVFVPRATALLLEIEKFEGYDPQILSLHLRNERMDAGMQPYFAPSSIDLL